MVTPALIWSGFDAASQGLSKAARKRLASAAECEIPARDSLELAAAALGIEPPPAAALARLVDDLTAEDRNWLRAEPVALVPDRDSLVLLPLAAAPLAREEEEALAAAARTHFGDALVLERGSSGRWYAAIETVREASADPLDAVIGRALVIGSLASGPDAAQLRAFLTELQMLWYEHPVNLSRRAEGRPEANALWLWGGGRLPIKPQISETVRFHANAPELSGLARWLGLECKALDEPEADAPQADAVVAIGPKETTLGAAWLERFAALRGGFRVYAAGKKWRIPSRRGWFHLGG